MTIKKSSRVLPRCTSVTVKDGSQCGRRVADGSNPPVCSVHQGKTTSPLIPPANEIDEIKILMKLARDSVPRVRLRAVDLLLDLKAKAKGEKTFDGSGVTSARAFVEALTVDERVTVRSLLMQM